jgi:hypothetical protein
MKRSLILILSLVLVLTLVGVPQADLSGKDKDTSMKIHHVRMLQGHALGMVTEGSNLIMNAGMKMSPAYDEMDIRRGLTTFDNSKSLVQGALSGDEMMAMHAAGIEDDPEMKELHHLGELILDYIAIVERMHIEVMDQGIMDMHHMHLMINHALNKVADGYNLVTLGNMGMAGDLDRFTIAHGRLMLKEAGPIIDTVVNSQSMKDLHAAGRGPNEDLFMYETHKLIETAQEIIDLLEIS